MLMAAHVADGMHWGVHGVPYHAESTLSSAQVLKLVGLYLSPQPKLGPVVGHQELFTFQQVHGDPGFWLHFEDL